MKLPPWDAPAAVMTAWVNERLDDMDEEIFEKLDQEMSEKHRQGSLDDLIRIAEHGEIDPLREELSVLLPTLAKSPTQAREFEYIVEHFLHLPKRKRGQRRYRLMKEEDHVGNAINDIKRIYALWRKYHGKRNRTNGLVGAETIAAERHGVTVDQINNRLKHRTKF
jgi:hypothetical protein